MIQYYYFCTDMIAGLVAEMAHRLGVKVEAVNSGLNVFFEEDYTLKFVWKHCFGHNSSDNEYYSEVIMPPPTSDEGEELLDFYYEDTITRLIWQYQKLQNDIAAFYWEEDE